MTDAGSGHDVLVREPPALEDYLTLRATAGGLSPKSAEQARPALANSWAWATFRRDGRTIAMGRVLGDGGWYFHIADMATLPHLQGRGLGRRVLTDLLTQIRDVAPPEPYITLMADGPGRPLYRALGFVETAPGTLGMRLPPTSGA